MQKFTQLLIATHNKGKCKQLKTLLQNQQIEILSLGDMNKQIDPIEENGATFAANAMLKARAVCQIFSKPTLADDSGLVVPLLGGRPGIFSARYAGNQATDAQNIEKILHELKAIDDMVLRVATFVCAIAFYAPNGDNFIVHGICQGQIAFKPHGSDGFGYDPIFYYPPLKTTFASLNPDEKLKINHRGRAFAAFLHKI